MSEPDEDKITVGQVHVSVGSAPQGVHMSTDFLLDDPDFEGKLSRLLESWMKATIVREKYNARLKG